MLLVSSLPPSQEHTVYTYLEINDSSLYPPIFLLDNAVYYYTHIYI